MSAPCLRLSSSPPANPEPRTLNSPTPRDFEIHRGHLVEHITTRNLAEKHKISQTRVRQIVARVTRWLTATVPIDTQAELEREVRLAQHLAADQLQHQIERLETLWTATCDPKYFRQQTRAILSLARLGTIPGTIDALAADAEERGADAPACQDGETEGQSDGAKAPASQVSLSLHHCVSPSSVPPPEDCSPESAPPTSDIRPRTSDHAATTSAANPSGQLKQSLEDQLDGLKIMERRLLILLDNVAPNDEDSRQSLEAILVKVRAGQEETIAELAKIKDTTGSGVFGEDQSSMTNSIDSPKTPDPFPRSESSDDRPVTELRVSPNTPGASFNPEKAPATSPDPEPASTATEEALA